MPVQVRTSTFQYVPVRSSTYLCYLNFAFFEIQRHPIISLVMELYTVVFKSQCTAWVYGIRSCLIPGIRTSTSMYFSQTRAVTLVLKCTPTVHTSTYRYVPVHTILPTVQGHRIPDSDALLLRRGRRRASPQVFLPATVTQPKFNFGIAQTLPTSTTWSVSTTVYY
jgi:hypothetical protein